MKIPDSQANVGAYYGNEENGQWQPNGVIIDSGVGGGVVGSGDAGVHRPPVYPVHIPRGHIPNYVMAGAYYPQPYPPGPAPQDDFEDYMWMENEEEFDKQVMQQLEEEALMEQCIEAMLEDEQRERHRPVPNGHNHYPTTSNGGNSASLEETVSRSTLNPLAAEFVPNRGRQANTETKVELTELKTNEAESKEEPQIQSETVTSAEVKEECRKEVSEKVPVQIDPPEVSAADIQPIDKDKKTTKKEVKKKEEKKPVRAEIKPKGKVVIVKSETTVQKKTELKVVKSEVNVDGSKEVPPSGEKHSPPLQPEEPQTTTAACEFKPINYAAAAKANKPKKPTTPPVTDKTAPPPKIEKSDKKLPIKEKAAQQRKNSAK